MKIKMYQVDAFAVSLFTGNPACVCLLHEEWLTDELMQKIAMENNVAETAFIINKNNEYHIRWFTPEVEVDLCGHATLASGHVLFNHENFKGELISFQSKSGKLSVRKDDEYLTLNFPEDSLQKMDAREELSACFDQQPVETFKGKTDYMLVFENEDRIRNIRCDIAKVSAIEARGIIVTARGRDVDFVSRFFAPQSGIAEDPVTGSAHTTLVPYWRNVLGKDNLTAAQLSERGGFLKCRYVDGRIEISGKALTYLSGEIEV